MSNRAVAPVVGVVLLVAVTASLAAVVGAGVVGSPVPPEPTTATFRADADATGEIRMVHVGGDPIDPEELRLAVRVDGEPLASQPPVPFFSAMGFESGPTGVFNSATRGEWRAGQEATLRVAASNEPPLRAGAAVEIRIYVDDLLVATKEVVVQAASTASPSLSASPSSASSASLSPPSTASSPSPEPPPAASLSVSKSTPPAPPAGSSGT